MTNDQPTLLYRAQDAVEAATLVHVLADAGIPARQVGGELALAWGELGADALLVEVWVPEDRLREARVVIEDYQAHPRTGDAAPWVCAGCDEENDGTFETCWKCQAERPG